MHTCSMQMLVWLEVAGAVSSIIYSLLLMVEKKAGWWFGIASSFIGAFLFFHTKIYAQSLISLYYAGIGFYGWWFWNKAEKHNRHIILWPIKWHFISIMAGLFLTYLTANVFIYTTDSAVPYLDSFVTVFGFIASVKEARKILTSWVYWGIINVLSAWLYFTQGLTVYGWLMLLYACICIPGYINWFKIYQANKTKQAA